MVYIGFCGEHFSISLRQMPRSAIAGKYGKLVNVSFDFFFNSIDLGVFENTSKL